MTEQTPLERLEEAISNWDACHPNDFEFFSQRLFDAAQSYMEWAEARIKELGVEMEKLIPLVALQAEQISRMSSHNETLVCSKLTPGWVRETNHYGDILRQIPANQPYINCPAWEKEVEDGS